MGEAVRSAAGTTGQDPDAVYPLGSSLGESARLQRQAEELAADSAVLLDRVGLRPGQCQRRDIMRYHVEAPMTDVLIRDIPDDVIAALDAHAARLGLSRSEYVRRRLAQDAATPGSPVSVNDLARFASTFADLADPDVMSRAWT